LRTRSGGASAVSTDQFIRAHFARRRDLSEDFRSFARLLLQRVRRVFPIEAFDAACGVEQLLLAREEWVAVGANFDAQHVALHCGLGLKRMSASAVNVNFVVIGMDAGFHCYLPYLWPVCTAKGQIPKGASLGHWGQLDYANAAGDAKARGIPRAAEHIRQLRRIFGYHLR
jgi:hypothetical protein